MRQVSDERLERAYQTALAALLAQRHPDGYWVGELSSSALSTATAISALSLVQKHSGTGVYQKLIDGGLAWLTAHQNADGGWGDTVKSFSNISTTMLCRAAFRLASGGREPPEDLAPSVATAHGPQGANAPRSPIVAPRSPSLERAEAWLFARYGGTPGDLAEAVRQRYGKDRTFAVPILATCALAGLVPWREVPPLPFELACLPQSWFRFLRLHVVSYALPALIALGQLVYFHRPPWNPIRRLVRALSRKRSLRVLERIQPSNGGFLEATPLTSFVTLSLAACGLADHPVAKKGAEFIVNSVRPDGSWPIDTNLSTWVTTLAINALVAAGELDKLDRREGLRDWLLRQQFQDRHAYTGAEPSGWGWTDLPGGVPDVDDTSGAVLALAHLQGSRQVRESEQRGARWLVDVQNPDGGWPTFCRGWGRLPFDRSGADLTAHAIRALGESLVHLVARVIQQGGVLRAGEKTGSEFWAGPAIDKGFDYLCGTQRPDGSWLPLWFGNQHAPDDENPTYGTARVLAAYRDPDMMNTTPAQRGVAWLVANQNQDGGWGGCKGCPSSVEETALAVEILLDALPLTPGPSPDGRGEPAERAVNNGLAWLVEKVEAGGLYEPAPIGFYFANLWYFEKLYPMIFTVAALGRAR